MNISVIFAVEFDSIEVQIKAIKTQRKYMSAVLDLNAFNKYATTEIHVWIVIYTDMKQHW